jgi:flagellar hook-associated protein 1 FlgK
MSNYSIALSGLTAAQKSLDIVGNNIANAATEGYHRQRVNLTPAYSSQQGSVFIGGGVKVEDVSRMIDNLLEVEIERQKSTLSQTTQESATLQTIENVFGEFLSDNTGLGAAIDDFFNSLRDLASYPSDPIWQNQAVSSAETLANQFRIIGSFLADMDNQLRLEIDSAVETINGLTSQTASLNDNIQKIEISGNKANNLSDTRDNNIAKLAELVGLQKQDGEYGAVNVAIGALPVVLGTSGFQIKTGFDEDGNFGLAMEGSYEYTDEITGGKVGALLNLKNEILPQIVQDINLLAQTIMQKVNDAHVQGCGVFGSFTELTGWAMGSGNLAALSSSISDGDFYIRLTNTATGQITRHKISVDASTDTMETIAAKISAVTGLNAEVIDSKLTILAEAGYKFDFMPAPLPDAEEIDFNGSSAPSVSVSGIFSGTANDVLTFTVVGTGSIGNGSLQLVAKNGSGQTIANLNIGSGYAAGDRLEVGNGIYVALSTGDLVDGDSFKINAFADTDTSGLLAAAGMNVFFIGTSAVNMAVSNEIMARPSRIATAIGGDFSDNNNISKIAELNKTGLEELGELSFGQYYRKVVADLGQDISTRQTRQEGLELMVQNLTNRQNEISGVDINQEAAQLLVFEQMFQAMAKYLSTIQTSLTTLMNVM